jgi:hypothetical protein
MTTPHETLSKLLSECGRALFDAYGVPASDGERPPRVEGVEVQVAGIIGFTGDAVRGSVMLAMSQHALEASRQSERDRPQDWIAELTNQLVGRLKNRLAAFDCDVVITTPLVIRGERIAPVMDGESAPLVWSLGSGKAYGWIDIEAREDFELIERPGAAVAAAEGDSFMF